VVLTQEGRRLLEARLGHLEEWVIPGLRAALVDREDAWAMYEWGVEDGALLERLLGVAVVAEDRPGGTDAVQLGDAVTGGSPTPRSGSWSSPTRGAPGQRSHLSVLAAGPGRARPPRR
jgi:hypothetical protein